MKVSDFGPLEAPVLLFGGPYSNLQATQAVIARAKAMGIGAKQMICTGDVVAYGAHAGQTVAEMRKLGCGVVAGNVEKQLAANAMDCGCGFDEGTVCDRLSTGWFSHADKTIGADDRHWMGTLPDMAVFTHHGQRYAVIHGGATDISRFIWPTSAEAVFAGERAAIEQIAGPVDAVIAGHSGIAFRRDVAGIEWINAGVIGMPPHDGAPATRFALLDKGRVEILSLTYDHAAAQRAMQLAGLTQGYDVALSSGVWPSEDVLPPDLRRASTDSG